MAVTSDLRNAGCGGEPSATVADETGRRPLRIDRPSTGRRVAGALDPGRGRQ